MPGVTRLSNYRGPPVPVTGTALARSSPSYPASMRSPEARASVDDRRRLLFNLGRATHVPHRAGTSGNQRSTTVNSMRLMSWPSLARAA